jgi:hypothetical protein
MTVDWKKAAEQYKKKPSEEAHKKAVTDAAQELFDFLHSEDGKSAKELLKASGRFIRFGEENPEGGRTTVFLINGDGLVKSQEHVGDHVAYSQNIPQPTLTGISAHQAVEAAFNYGRMAPNALLGWLRSQLDAIAEQAPK